MLQFLPMLFLIWFPANTRLDAPLQFTHLSSREGLSQNTILCMTNDQRGFLWLGTQDGLNRYDGYGFRVFKPEPNNPNAISDRYIRCLYAAPDEALWEDGLPGDEFNTGAVLLGGNGQLYFGGIDGLVSFAPRQFVTNPNPPPVAVTSFTRLEEGVPVEIPLRPTPDLSCRDRVLQFSIAALDYTVPEKNAYAYRLDDSGPWVPLGRSHQVTFTDLSPGRYRFQARASNSDGVWHEKGVVVPFVIAPPWWQTPLAYALYILLGAGLVLGFTLRLIAINRFLKRKVADRTSALEESNREIVRTQEQLVMREKMASLGVLTAGMAHEINNPNNFAHNSADLMQQDLAGFQRFVDTLAGDDDDEPILLELRGRLQRLSESNDLILNGTARIKTIVGDLKNFTYRDGGKKVRVAPGEGLKSTVNLIQSR